MNKLKYLILVLAMASLWFAASCGGDDEPSPTDLLSKTWVVDNIRIVDGVAETDRTGYTFTFRTDGTYTFNAPTAQNGTWQFQANSNNRVIVLDGSVNVSIIKTTETELDLEFDEPTFKDPNRKIVYELVPQV